MSKKAKARDFISRLGAYVGPFPTSRKHMATIDKPAIVCKDGRTDDEQRGGCGDSKRTSRALRRAKTVLRSDAERARR